MRQAGANLSALFATRGILAATGVGRGALFFSHANRRIGGQHGVGPCQAGRRGVWASAHVGHVGFVLTTITLGQLVTRQDVRLAFWLHAILLGFVCAGLGLLLPISRRAERVDLWSGIKRLVGQRSYLSFLAAMALLGIGTSSYVNFLGLHLLALGGDDRTVSWAWALNGLAEGPIMFLGTRWFRRFSFRRLLLVGFGGYTLVWIGMALAQRPVQIMTGAFLIGLCYGTLWVAAVNYASEAAPPGLGATAQALVGAAQAGVGWGLGAIIAGYVWDSLGGSAVFWVAAGAALLAGMAFLFGNQSVWSRFGDTPMAVHFGSERKKH